MSLSRWLKRNQRREKKPPKLVQYHNGQLPQNKQTQSSTKQVKRELNPSWKTSKARQVKQWIGMIRTNLHKLLPQKPLSHLML